MEEFVSLDSVSTEDIFPNENFQLFPQFFQHSDDSFTTTITTKAFLPNKS